MPVILSDLVMKLLKNFSVMETSEEINEMFSEIILEIIQIIL